MHSRLLLALCVTELVWSSGASASPILKSDARQEVLAVARRRLNQSANRTGSDAALRLDHADKIRFFFDAHATRPCLPGERRGGNVADYVFASWIDRMNQTSTANMPV